MKPLPDHGTTARAKGRPGSGVRGCSCPPCRRAENAYAKRRRHLAETGRALTVPAEPVREHLQRLITAGAGWNQLEAATGLGGCTLRRLRRGRYRRLHRSTAAAILALQPGDCAAPGRSVPAIGSTRRLRALTAVGYSRARLAIETGLDPTTIKRITAGVETLAAATADTIAATYTRLAHTTATPSRTASRASNDARRAGWPDPTWWEDYGHLDDPDFDPRTAEVRDKGRAWLAAEINHLMACGVSTHEIATRVDRTEAYVRQILAGHRSPGQRRQYEEAA
ncbi:hypothetical protein QNO07_09595 [Streptomyces sp. 549]|uniref:hypothetical protein n=1 Tax=Streptomyces sp. 549 TaxID=3049076 RepID=UPI0024C281B3|nr:hypothetical protein [Streptomyces sp. 549]MDK1473673.1 hypothetical protein [Streptomyces sp. 549]